MPAAVGARHDRLLGRLPAGSVQLAVEAESVGDDHAARICHMAVASGNVNMGELDAAEAAVDAVRAILARRRLPFAHHTAPMLVGIAACVAAWRGDIEQGRRIAEAPGQADAVITLAKNAYAAMAAYAAGDLALVERLEQWQAAAEEGMQAHLRLTNETHNLAGPALNVHWVRALIEAPRRRAGAPAAGLPRLPASPGIRGYILVPFATQLLAAGGADELMRVCRVQRRPRPHRSDPAADRRPALR